MRNKYILPFLLALSVLVMSGGCGSSNDDPVSSNTTNNGNSSGTYLTSIDITTTETLSATDSDKHALEVSGDGAASTRSNLLITKTGDSSGEDSDFYGTNAAVLAANGATLTLTDSLITTDGAYANGVFSYGSGTTVNVKDSVISPARAIPAASW